MTYASNLLLRAKLEEDEERQLFILNAAVTESVKSHVECFHLRALQGLFGFVIVIQWDALKTREQWEMQFQYYNFFVYLCLN